MSGNPLDAGAVMFERQTSRSDIPVLVDVWAPWCGPCRMMAPAFEAAAGILEPEIRLIKLNSEEEQGIAGRLDIRGIATMLHPYFCRKVIVRWVKQRAAGKFLKVEGRSGIVSRFPAGWWTPSSAPICELAGRKLILQHCRISRGWSRGLLLPQTP